MEVHHTTILVFAPLYPPHVGGLESHAAQFNEELAARNYQIVVLTPRTAAGGKDEERRQNITVYRFPAWEIIPNYPLPKIWKRKFWQYLGAARRTRPQLLISRTRFFITSALALFYSRRWRLPLLHIEHGSDHAQLSHPLWKVLAKLYDQTLGKLVLRRAHSLVANSQASAAFVKKLSGRTSTVIYRGIPHSLIEKTPALPLANKSQPILIYIGRLIDGKGVSDLFHTLPLLEVTCWIIGDGSQRSALQTLAHTLNIQPKIKFWGEQSFEKAIAALKAADILVHPSYSEGLPTSVIEAALCRKAIVATDVGGTAEIITNNISGFLVPPRNVAALQQKIEQLVKNPRLRHDFGQRAYDAVSTRFTWDVSVQKYEKIIQTLCAASSAK